MADNATTDSPDRQHQHSSRMTIADATTAATTSTPQPQRQRQQQQQQEQRTSSSPTTLHTLLGIADERQHMEFSQIELIYRAEGNANLVLALLQFKKVLRLPKLLSAASSNAATKQQHNQPQQKCDEGEQQQQQHQSASDPALNQNVKAPSDNLTMEDFAAYIEIMRRLLGNEFVFETDIVRIPKLEDRQWINAHIRAARPAHRLDKEFCGEFGLLLPDATRLPIAFDILLSNLQAKLIGDTYAIEIKPKQGWLLPSAVNDLFDIKPAARATAQTTAEAATSCGTAPMLAKLDNRCRYCAMQFLKLRQEKVSKRSAYCPLDLFSGQPSRMLRALDALFECPQNNLRIFRNGILIYGDQQHPISGQQLTETHFQGAKLQLIKDLVVKCLLWDYDGEEEEEAEAETDAGDIVKAVVGQPHLSAAGAAAAAAPAGVKVETEAEPATQASTHQPKNRTTATSTPTPRAMATATATTTEALAKATAPAPAVAPETEPEPEPQPEPTTQAQITEVEMLCLPKNCVLQKILHLQLLAKRNLHLMRAAGYAQKSERSYNALNSLLSKCAEDVSYERLLPVEQYLLAATALDCSIILAFQEISMNCSPTANMRHIVQLPKHANHFLTKVTLVDLDPKPDSHFFKYVKQTKEAYNCCQEHQIPDI